MNATSTATTTSEQSEKPPVAWTSQQRAAISTTGRNLLVSAAAGSGKTAVLAERCAHLVCDADPACDVDQLLVVTFTEVAAAEMKSRIETALRQRLEQSDDPRLHRELALIERAQISTLHGFCARLLRQYYHLVGLGPDFRILDRDEAALMRHEVARDLFDDRYESSDAADFQRFIDHYGDGKDEHLLHKVVRTYEMLQSLVDPGQWMAYARSRISEAAQKPLAASELGRQLLDLIRAQLARAQCDCREALAWLRGKKVLEKYFPLLSVLETELDDWTKILSRGNLEALAARVNDFQMPRVPSISKDAPGKARAVAYMNAVRGAMKDGGLLGNLLRFTEKQWRDGLANIESPTGVFLDLIQQFGQRYAQAKRLAHGIDFSDLEVLTLRVLRDASQPGLAPSAAARACRQQFAQVLVDEYQDINEVQDAILKLVSRDGGAAGNLFCVGDVKQSIYRFRLADPSQFQRKDQTFRDGSDRSGTVIDLQSNFRSREPLLEALNSLFEKLMTRQAADINYDDSQKLRAGKSYPQDSNAHCFTGRPIELHLIGKDAPGEAAEGEEATDGDGDQFDRTEKEAAFVAHRIHELMGHCDSDAMCVLDRDESGKEIYRKLQYRDIVILLRSMQFRAEQFAEQLRLANVPTHRDSNTGYFDSLEVRDVLSLLSVLDNQRQDIALAAVLRSPLLGLRNTEELLARIRIAYPHRPPAADKRQGALPFHEAVVRYATERTDLLAQRLREKLAQLAAWRELCRQRPLAEVLWTIYQHSGYLAFVGGFPNGRQRVANLIDLHERAKQFGAFSRQGLFRFLQFLQTLAEEGDLGLPSVLGEAEDVVRIMSIHAAKGLEFPVVFVPDLGKKINTQDCEGSILVDRQEFVGLSVIDEGRQVRYPSLASALVQNRLRQQAMAEELRVLYVATTRAREHLILVGTINGKQRDKWVTIACDASKPLAAEQILSAVTMLDWIGPVASMLEAQGQFSISQHSGGQIAQWAAQSSEAALDETKLQLVAALKPLPSGSTRPEEAADADARAAALIQRLSAPYAFAELAKSAASQPAAAWAKSSATVEVAGAPAATATATPLVVDELLAKPKFALETTGLSATEAGDATHLVLQHLDFRQTCRGENLRLQIDDMVRRHVLTRAQAEVVNHSSIEWFCGTVPGKLASAATDDLRREYPFQLAIPSPLSADPRDAMMVRGRIDLLIPDQERWIIVDYKTDRVLSHESNRFARAYEAQANLYRQAVQAMDDRKVAAVYLVYLTGKFVHEVRK